MTWQELARAGGKMESLYIKTGHQTEWDNFFIEVSRNCGSLWKRTWTNAPQKASSCLLSPVGRANALLPSLKTCRWVQGKVGAWPYFHQAFKDRIMSHFYMECWRKKEAALADLAEVRPCFLSSVNRMESDPACSSVDVTWLTQHMPSEEVILNCKSGRILEGRMEY